ncbi:hypothetical protein AQI88_38215 [Streptomyces cellostaticus]|uniref:Uncharacterized protein n=1 Tax=Streptomyces cellostaticus TaxID=67285 RepID=A0A101NDK0_9ACTN|nr:hypothetical protein [Streptomyces cellostaticus]KUM91164.1 hypothetical protein AQI88_38215 [Streptomyces cellostaticus]GHI02786.1 hypothetical protein Scel_11070 [Streptomyces cellostaticus]
MHSNDDTNRTTGGLSTEDLAQPSGATTGTPEATDGASARAPMYPGESTATTAAQSPAEQRDGDRSAVGSDARAAATNATRAPDTSDTSDTSDDEAPQLLTEDEDQNFRDRWQKTQNKFVDDPREAVHDADALVADVMQTLATTFAQHKKDLEDQWGQGEHVDTEELRRALRRYRSFFNRLLTT